jgi:hypothetical protein
MVETPKRRSDHIIPQNDVSIPSLLRKRTRSNKELSENGSDEHQNFTIMGDFQTPKKCVEH